MALSKFVKISNVSNLSDARYCAGMMVDILGFEISDPTNEFYVGPDTFKELTGWIAGIDYAGEIRNSSLDNLGDLLSTYDVNHLEFTSKSDVPLFQGTDKKLIYRCQVAKTTVQSFVSELKEVDQQVDIIIIDCEPEVNESVITALLKANRFTAKLLKGYDVSPENIQSLPSFWDGIELKTTLEEKPGFKDFGEIMDILELLDED